MRPKCKSGCGEGKMPFDMKISQWGTCGCSQKARERKGSIDQMKKKLNGGKIGGSLWFFTWHHSQ